MATDMEVEKRRTALLDSLLRHTAGVWSSNTWWWRWLLLLSVLALTTRVISLDQPPGTAWDEVHFGGFGNMYINRTYFHDVHPPLGKMAVAGAMYLTGYSANFSFAVSTFYPPHFQLALVRGMFGLVGAVLVPLAFLTVWHLTGDLPASVLAGLAILTDHYIHRLCTLILLDGPLLMGILASVCCSFAFHNTKQRAWSPWWWAQLSATGLCLGTIMSIKYIAVFTVVFVGIHTAYQLITILMDPQKPMWLVVPHTAARALCLILLPVGLYLATFVLHFAVLNKWTPHAGGFYHMRFTSSFENTEYEDKFFPKYLDYGANISLKNSLAMSGYLESWFDLFPSAFTAPCQQVTLTTLKDDESLTWTIRFVNVSAGQVEDSTKAGPGGRRVVRNGDHIVLTHQATGRSLRTHGHRAPVTKRHFQVCGYGDDGEAGPFETWQLLVPGLAEGMPIETLGADFMLKSFQMNCYMVNPSNTPLPNWAFESAKEVSCTKNVQSPGIMWHINWVNATRLPLTRTAREYSMSLWEKILYQHEAMILGNSGLKPLEKDMENSARPWMWPLLYRLQVLCVYNTEVIARHLRSILSVADIPANQTSVDSETNATLGATSNKSSAASESSSSVRPSSALTSSSTSKLSALDEEHIKNGTTPEPNEFGIKSVPGKVRTESTKIEKEIYGVFMHNPVLAYTNLLSFVLVASLVLFHFFKMVRKSEESQVVFEKRQRTVVACFWITVCWALHYFPFFAMARILYTHHYCPAYCYSCMLTGVILGHLCESLSSWCSTKFKDLLLTCFILVPATLFLTSYWLLFPFAIVLEGRFAYPHATLSTYLDHLNLGQPWVEFGYSPDSGTFVITTKTAELSQLNFNNLDLNASLYYNTSLYPFPVDDPVIEPVAASNYSLWRPQSQEPSSPQQMQENNKNLHGVDEASPGSDQNSRKKDPDVNKFSQDEINDRVKRSDDNSEKVSENDGVKVSENDGVKVSENDGVKVSENDGVKVSENDGVKVSESDGVKVSENDGVKVSENDGVKVSESDGVKVSENDGVKVSENDGVKVSENDGVKVSEIDGVKVSENDGVKVSENDGVKVSENDGVKVSENDGVKVSESDGAKVSESDGVKVSESDGVKVSESDGAKVSESDGVKVSESDGVKVSESDGVKVSGSDGLKMSDKEGVGIKPSADKTAKSEL